MLDLHTNLNFMPENVSPTIDFNKQTDAKSTCNVQKPLQKNSVSMSLTPLLIQAAGDRETIAMIHSQVLCLKVIFVAAQPLSDFRFLNRW